MSVLASVCSYNDPESLAQCVAALRSQSRPVDRILVVDNRSVRGVPTEDLPEDVAVLCNLRNIGPAGAAATAIEYARARSFEWLWVLDQDSSPEADVLENLLELYRSLPAALRLEVGALTPRMVREPGGDAEDFGILTPHGPRPAPVAENAAYYECDSGVWSGSLFRLAAVERVGLPAYGEEGYWDGLNIDWGDVEFHYRLRRNGFRILVHRSSFLRHRLGGEPKKGSLFGAELSSTNHPAFRRYLYFRNMTYFWLYLHRDRRLLPIVAYLTARLGATSVKILVLEEDRARKLAACVRGVWDGALKRIHERV